MYEGLTEMRQNARMTADAASLPGGRPRILSRTSRAALQSGAEMSRRV